MLLFRINNSMDKVLEGIDKCDIRLLMEANAEFEKGYNDLKSAVSEFISLLQKIEPMKEFASIVGALLDELKGVDKEVKELPEEFSFTANYNIKNKEDSDEARAMKTISGAATTISMYINGLKDAILAVAEWLEDTPEIFSVGKNGIVVLPQFAEKNQGSPMTLEMFSKPSADEILQAIAEPPADGDQQQALKDHFSDLWNGDGVTDESQLKQKWEKFVSGIDGIAQSGQSAFAKAENAVKNIKPDDDVKNSVESKSILSSVLGKIFGGSKQSSATSPDMSQIVSKIIGNNAQEPNQGLWACTFEELQELISGLLAMADAANASAAAALAGINKQNQAEKSDKQKSLIEKLNAADLDAKEAETVAMIVDKLSDNTSDTSKINLEEFTKMLANANFNDDKINLIIKELGLKKEESDDVLSNVKEFKKDKWASFFGPGGESKLGAGTGQVIGRALEDLGLLKLTESVHLINEGLVEDLISKVEEYTDIDDKLKQAVLKKLKKQGAIDWIKNKLELQESFRLIDRWGELAGIIKS